MHAASLDEHHIVLALLICCSIQQNFGSTFLTTFNILSGLPWSESNPFIHFLDSEPFRNLGMNLHDSLSIISVRPEKQVLLGWWCQARMAASDVAWPLWNDSCLCIPSVLTLGNTALGDCLAVRSLLSIFNLIFLLSCLFAGFLIWKVEKKRDLFNEATLGRKIKTSSTPQACLLESCCEGQV